VLTATPRHRPRIKGIERRAHYRLPFECLIRWTGGEVDRTGISRDISAGGAGFTARPLCTPRVGDRISLTLELDEGRACLLDERARVVRCDPRDDGCYDIGVQLNGDY
jgi:hypothetical protein